MNSILLFFFLLFCSIPFTSAAEVDKKELNTFLEAIKEKEDEELLIGSEQFKECESQLENFRKESQGDTKGNENRVLLRKCIAGKVIGEPGTEDADTKLLEVAKNLSLSSYNPEASKTSASIRKYLGERIDKAIYGKKAGNSNQKLNELKLVNHDVYYQLYAEQIGKNTLLEVSRYCLENFGLKNKLAFLYLDTKDKYTEVTDLITHTNKFMSLDTADKKSEFLFADKYELAISKEQVQAKTDELKTLSVTPVEDLWKKHDENIVEYQVCTLPNEKQCVPKYKDTPFRNIEQIRKLKELEFLLSSKDPKKELIKSRYTFCAGKVLQNMCEIYKCHNVYDASTDTDTKKVCQSRFNIAVTRDNSSSEEASAEKQITLKSTTKKGFIACNILGRLEEYRMALKGIKVIQADNVDNQAISGISAVGEGSAGFKDIYAGKGGKIDKITSIGSQDLISGVEEFKNAQESAKKLQDECLDGNSLDGWKLKDEAAENENCKILLAKLDDAKLGVIELDTEAKTALKLKEMEDIKSKEDLGKYLTANGLDKFIGKLETLEVDQLKELIKDDFKSKRMAMIDNLNARFETEKKLRTGAEDDDVTVIGAKNSIANQTISDMTEHQKRVEVLFEYSNIVSSYLVITNEDDEIVGSNATGRSVELESNQELKDNGYFSTDDQSGGSGDSLDYLSAIDQILGISDKKEEEALQIESSD